MFERYPTDERFAVEALLERLGYRLDNLPGGERIDFDGVSPPADDTCGHQLFLTAHCLFRLRRAATEDPAFRWAALAAAIRCRDALAEIAGQAPLSEAMPSPSGDDSDFQETRRRCSELARFHQLPQVPDSAEAVGFLYDTIMCVAVNCLTLVSSGTVGTMYPEIGELRDQLERDDQQRRTQYRQRAL